MADLAPFAAVLSKDLATPNERDRVRAIYRLHQSFEHHGKTLTRKGFVARVRLSAPADGAIAPHESAPAEAVAEQQKLMRAARAHPTPAVALYADAQHRSDALFEAIELNPPELEAATPDGVTHRVWRLTDEKTQAQLAAIVSPERLYLTDGVDRYQAMLALRDELAAGKTLPDDSALHWGAMFFCNLDDPGLETLPTHRVLHGLPAFDRAKLLVEAREYFTITEGPLSGPDAVRPALAGQAKRAPAFAMVTPGLSKIAYLRLRGDLIKGSVPQLAESRTLGELDLTYLHRLVLEEKLALDAATLARHLRYTRDWEQAFAELSSPDVQALFLVNPTRFDLMRGVLDEGRLMPERSIFIHPKLPAGLITNPVDPAEAIHIPSLY